MGYITRFAPSPTGFLHLGGVRTAIFNFLLSRKSGGNFYLRIEDTDPERSKDEFRDDIVESLKWLSLDWDGEIVYQSARREMYDKYLNILLSNGFAYRCYCERGSSNKDDVKKVASRYNRKCRDLSDAIDMPHVIRFKMPLSGTITVKDLVKGEVEYDLSLFDDFIIRRQDGSYTYNFTVVCDDIQMKISHVFRGNDHLNNTPKQIEIYNALNEKPPEFGHLPLILGQDGSRLSKRHGATSVNNYRMEGYLPEAMVNFLAKIGWSHGDREFYSINELISDFDIEGISKSSGIFNIEKLNWLNKQHLISKSNETIFDLLTREGFIKIAQNKNLLKLIDLTKIRSRNLVELATSLDFYINDTVDYKEDVLDKVRSEDAKNLIQNLLLLLEKIENFDSSTLEVKIRELSLSMDIKLKRIAEILRIILTGREVSPGIFDCMELLGKERTFSRLMAASKSI